MNEKKNTDATKKAAVRMILEQNGWVLKPIGFKRTTVGKKTKVVPLEGFDLYVRETPMTHFFKNASNKGSQKMPGSPVNTGLPTAGSNPPMGNPTEDLTPVLRGSNPPSVPLCTDSLPELSNFSKYPSLVSARPDKPCILIGYDSEWQTTDTGRDMLSWQFALIWNGNLFEFCFLKAGENDLTLNMALGCILDYICIPSVDLRSIKRYAYCLDWRDGVPVVTVTVNVNEARNKCVYVYRDGTFTHELIKDMLDNNLARGERGWAWFHTYFDYSVAESVKVTLVCHNGKVDISSFDMTSSINIMRFLTEVQGGTVTLQPVRIAPRSLKNVNNTNVYPVSLSVGDTMCHAPAGKKKLKDLGEAVGIEKIHIQQEQKAKMGELLEEDPALFMEYASTDSVVTLMYSSAVYGYNNTPPVTVTSATAAVMKETMMDYLGCTNTDGFNYKYRGLQKVSHGLVPRDDRPGYVESTSLEPVSDIANTIQYYASQAYHGGYNSCSEVGYFSQETFDYDLQNAYPTAMCLVADIDWEFPVRAEVLRRNLDIRNWVGIGGFNPITPFVGYVRFEFPVSVKYPCIPVNVDGIPVYPRTSNGLDGVYVAGPYIYLALRLGAAVYCERGYFLNTLLIPDFKESRSLASSVKQLVEDRNQAKIDCGKKSLEELILKTMVNSGYGKNAQNVVQKHSWTALKNTMEDLGCSSITNPVSAMMTTAIVQVELLAAQKQINELGYVSCSVTTDGFISDCPEETLKQLDLYGIRPFIESSRIFLTGDPELWEAKHHQNDLINFCTRGNVSLLPHGVCAHNSTKSGYESDSYEDRLWLMTQVLSRVGTVNYTEDEWTSFKELAQGKPFIVKPVTRHIRMDFDLKRKPDKSTFRTDKPIVEGIEYEIAHFDTLPYEDVAEFRLYRAKKELTDVLRTEAHWNIFWRKLELNAAGNKVRDMDWAILNSCIMGYRAGRWSIPALDRIDNVEEKCFWINEHNTSRKQFRHSDWKNSRRPERQVNMLPYSMIEDKLNELVSSDYQR